MASETATPVAAIPADLAALRAKFSDPLKLKGLSILDVARLSPEARAADDWFKPALDLLVELQRRPRELVIERDGSAAIDETKLSEEYKELLAAPALPDIVHEQLQSQYRRLHIEQTGRERRDREAKRIRRDRLTWLRGSPIQIFDGETRVLPEHRHLFSKQVLEMDGIREAMIKCHVEWMREQRARSDMSHQKVVENRFENLGQVQPERAEPDDPWDAVLDAAFKSGRGVPGKPDMG